MNKVTFDKFSALIANELRGSSLDHFDLLARKHFIASWAKPIQDKLDTTDESERRFIRDCIASCVETAIEAFLQSLQEEDASIKFRGGEELILAEIQNLAEKVFKKWENSK